MKRFMALIWEFFLAKRIHVGCLAFVSTVLYLRLAAAQVDLRLAGIAFLIVWAAYLENLTTDRREDRLNTRSPHGISPDVEAKLPAIERLYPCVYLAAAVFAAMVSRMCLAWTLAGIVVFISYVHRVFPLPGKGWVRLKQLYIVKNIIPPLGWLCSVWIMPLAASGKPVHAWHWVFGAMVVLFSFREEVKFDISDEEGDRQAGIRTLPNTLGEAKTRRVLDAISHMLLLLVFWMLALLFRYGTGAEFCAFLTSIFPLLTAFAFDHRFVDGLYASRRKEYCNIGIVWWTGLLLLYMLLPFVWAVAVYALLRLAGSVSAYPLVARTLQGKP